MHLHLQTSSVPVRVSFQLAFLILAFFSALSFAQTGHKNDEQDLFSLSLQELLQVSVSSSTLIEQELKSAPSSITAFNYESIQNLGVDYLHELLNYVPGFQSFRQEESGDEYYHSSRGRRSSTSSREVLILIDGQRFNREFDNAIAVPMISLSNVEKIEFIRGPGSAIYGSNAFLGVIDISTHHSRKQFGSSIGENGRFDGHLSFSEQLSALAVSGSLNASRDNGEKVSVEEQFTSQTFRTRDEREGLDFNLRLTHSLMNLDLLHFERESHGFSVLGETGNELDSTQNRFSSIRLSKTFEPSEEFSSEFSARHYRESYSPLVDHSLLGLSSFVQRTDGQELQIRNKWQLSKAQKLLFGAEHRKARISEAQISSKIFGADALHASDTRDILGLYLQHQWLIQSETELTLGLRHDNYSEIGGSTNPRFGIVHHLSEQHTLKLLYGEAFRAPTINEAKVRDFFNFGVLVGNPSLKPEKVKTVEAIWMTQLSRSSFALTLFENVYEQSIVRDVSMTPESYFNKAGSDSSQGLEAEWMALIFSRLSVSGTYSWIRNLGPEDLRQSERLASLGLNYQQDQWNANVSALFTDERHFFAGANRRKLGQYPLFNAKFRYAFLPSAELFLQAKNLFDKQYRTPPERANFQSGVSNRGRELSVGLRWELD